MWPSTRLQRFDESKDVDNQSRSATWQVEKRVQEILTSKFDCSACQLAAQANPPNRVYPSQLELFTTWVWPSTRLQRFDESKDVDNQSRSATWQVEKRVQEILYIYIHIFLHIYTYLFICLFIYLFIHLFIYLFTNLFAFLFTYLLAYLLTNLFIYLSIYLSIHLFIHSFIYSYICQSERAELADGANPLRSPGKKMHTSCPH